MLRVPHRIFKTTCKEENVYATTSVILHVVPRCILYISLQVSFPQMFHIQHVKGGKDVCHNLCVFML